MRICLSRFRCVRAAGWIAALATAAWAAPVRAQVHADEVPKELEGVGITQKLDAQIPLDLEFFNEKGRPVTLREYFNGQRPVMLTLNYYRCPGLCNYQLNGLTDGLKQMQWTPGKEFDIVTVSFDPLEDAKLADLKKEVYIAELGRPGAAGGWHFLVGRIASIRALTAAVGFGYRWNQDTRQFAHDAATIICTPTGRISRYLGGLIYEPDVLKMSLVEASAGKVGSLWDALFLTCFHYDARQNRYTPAIMNLMRMGGFFTVVVLGTFLAAHWLRERRRKMVLLGS